MNALIEQFDLLATSAGGIAKLRELILSLAVRGQLVPQDPNDEPASELLKKIRAEKDRLIAEGKIKRDKPLAEIGEDEKPYKLPSTWLWVRFGDLFSLEYGDNLPAEKRSGSGEFPVYGSNGIVGTHSSGSVSAPCIVVGRKGSAGALNLSLTPGCWVTDVAYSCIPPAQLNLLFVFKLFHTLGLDVLGKGIKPGLNRNEAYQLPVGVPPLAEQSRIVAKVEELMALCDRLEAEQGHAARVQRHWVEAALDQLAESADSDEFRRHWQHLAEHFGTLFTTPESIERLNASLLQLAVRGKLVQQDANDEPASELLKQIRAEKDRMILEGKIKRDKPLSPIAEGEKPFDLPNGWVWARFPELGEFGRGKSKHRPRNDPALFNPGIYPLVQTGEVSRANRIVREYHSKYSDVGLAQSKMWPAGTLCITIAANIAESALLGFDACFPDSVVGFVPAEAISDASYFLTFIETARERLLEFAPATAQKNINLEILQSVLIPIPPLREMRRIVVQVEKLLALTADLKARLAAAQGKQVQLVETLIAEAC